MDEANPNHRHEDDVVFSYEPVAGSFRNNKKISQDPSDPMSPSKKFNLDTLQTSMNMGTIFVIEDLISFVETHLQIAREDMLSHLKTREVGPYSLSLS